MKEIYLCFDNKPQYKRAFLNKHIPWPKSASKYKPSRKLKPAKCKILTGYHLKEAMKTVTIPKTILKDDLYATKNIYKKQHY